MKLPVVILLFLVIQLSQACAPRSPAGLGACAVESGSANRKSVTVEDRKNDLKQLEQCVQVALSSGQTLEAARILNRIGGLHRLLNQSEAAVASHLQALDLLRQSPDPQVEVDNLNGSAAAYLNLQKQDAAAQAALDKALSLSKQIQYTAGEAQALLTLSDLQNRKNHQTALLTAQQALALWKSLGDKEGIARSYGQIGSYYLALELKNEAVKSFAQAMELWRELNDTVQQAAILISLGFAEYRMAEWQSCIKHLGEAYSLLDESAEPFQMGRITSGLGASFMEYGSPEMAVVQFQRARDYYRRAEEPIGVSYATVGLARSYFSAGDLTQATNYLQEALKPVERHSVAEALVFEYLGRVHIERGEYPAALKHLESTFKTYTEAGNVKEAARVCALLGQIYDRQGLLSRNRPYYQEALKNYKEALKTFTRLSDRVNQAALYYALGKLEMKLKNFDAANDYLKKSIDVTEDMRGVATSDDLMTAFSANVQERYEAYIECLMKQHEKEPAGGFAIKAFETSELARARTLSELLLAVQAPGVDPKLAARQRSLLQTLRRKESEKIALLAKTVTREQLKDLEEETARLEAEYKAVNETIRSRYPSYDKISRPSAWNLREIQEQILPDDDAVLLEYSGGVENSYAWTVTRNEFKTYKLPPQKVINEAVQRVYNLLKTSPIDGAEAELAQSTAELSKLVLEPVASSLNKQRIIVVADGALNYIPFQLLHASSAAGDEPLISKYEVINVPSASILGQLRQEKQQRPPRSRILAAFGDPVFESNYAQMKNSNSSEMVASGKTDGSESWQRAWRDVEINADNFDPSVIQPLAYSRFELKHLSDIAGRASFVARGFDASRQMLETMDLSKYAILHFATHGVLDPKRPELSGFFLSMVDSEGRPQNGFITMQDVYRLQAPVDLVVLSACRTGLGKDVRGEGLIGLTRGFMYAGASSVVASLWKVDDEATSELMKHFYANMLQKGMRPAEALRAAQNTLKLDPQWKAPHFWAGFTIQGEFKQPIGIPTQTLGTQTHSIRAASLTVQKSVGALLLMILLAGIAWGYWRRRPRIS